MRALGFAVSVGILLLGCSSSGSSSSSSTSSTSGSSSCSCTGQADGESFEIACGSQQCVAGATYSCAAGAELTQGEPCASTTDGGGVASGSGCQLFACKASADCGGIAPCFSSSDGKDYCYEQEASPTACSPGTSPTLKPTTNGATTICVPASCPAPVTFIP